MRTNTIEKTETPRPTQSCHKARTGHGEILPNVVTQTVREALQHTLHRE